MNAQRQRRDVLLAPEQGEGAAQGFQIAVLLCGRLGSLNTGLDLQEIRRWLLAAFPSVRAAVAPDLCLAPKAASPTLRGMQRVLFAVCSSEFAEPEARQEVQRAGLDPLAAAVLNLGAYASHVPRRDQATEKAKVLLAGAIARVRSTARLGPQHHRPILAPLGQRVSRRSLFTVPPVRYQPVAAASAGGCLAEAGCDLCIRACPRGALFEAGGRVRIEKEKCEGCGACTAACPAGVLELVGDGPRELAAQLTGLLGVEPGMLAGRTVAFLCPQAAREVEVAEGVGAGASPGIYPLDIPCAAAVPAGLLLQVVARGWQANVAPCPDSCPRGLSSAFEERVDYCRKLIAGLGLPPDAVRIAPTPEAAVEGQGISASSVGRSTPPKCFEELQPGMDGTTGAVVALAAEAGLGRPPVLQHPASPFGLVHVDAAVCTGCGSCAEACPTGALQRHADQETTSLSFDATRCMACGKCVEACPETERQAIRLAKATDPSRLTLGRTRVHEDSTLRCVNCGAPVMSAAMLSRLGTLLGEENRGLAEHLAHYCIDCRAAR